MAHLLPSHVLCPLLIHASSREAGVIQSNVVLRNTMCTGANEQMVPAAAATSQDAASFHSVDVHIQSCNSGPPGLQHDRLQLLWRLHDPGCAQSLFYLASLQTCLEFLRCTPWNGCPHSSTCVGSKGHGSKVGCLCHAGAWARAIHGILCISGNGFLLDQLHWPPAQPQGRPQLGRVWSCVCLLCCCGNTVPWYVCYYLHCGSCTQ